MLIQLSIRNIVLIESCDISLKSGLCVLSGETGAGKSILLDALGLVLGARADVMLVRQGEAQASVTAEFDVSDNASVQEALSDLGLEPSDMLIIRRTLMADGKTRCLINDQSTTVATLKKLGDMLVEVHGQHDQKSLMDMHLHRSLLDDYAALSAARKAAATAYRNWKKELDILHTLHADIAQTAREQDYLRHMKRELEQLHPEAGEDEALSSQRTSMMQSEKLFSVLDEAMGDLNEGKGVTGALRAAQRVLMRSPLTVSPAFTSIIDALDRAAIEAEEALVALERIGKESQYNPQKLEQIEERLFALKAAGRKYNLPVDELPKLYQDVSDKLKLIDSQEHRIGSVEKAAAAAKATFVAASATLTEGRKKAALKLEKAIQAELKPLKMENTRFRVRLEALEESGWSEYGTDAVYFECATNVVGKASDAACVPLNKIASGGELSRFMLAMKVALLSVRSPSTLIFDEIDSGTGGAVADAIGQRLSMLGKTAQVLVVTHLPQVAARGTQHLLVQKLEKGRKVVTSVTEIAGKEREEELARMLAGATITPEARKAARKLLEQAA